jgi:hypothetical protein
VKSKQAKPISVNGVQATHIKTRINAALHRYRRAVEEHFEKTRSEPEHIMRARKLVNDYDRGETSRGSWRDRTRKIDALTKPAEENAVRTEGRALFAQPAERALEIVALFEESMSAAVEKMQQEKKK